MNFKIWFVPLLTLLAGCALHPGADSAPVNEIVITRFQSTEPSSCRPSDVPLDQKSVRRFFQRAEAIDSRVLHDNFEWAPCYLEGMLKYRGLLCAWQVRAGATAVIECPAFEQFFACKDCDELFVGARP